MIEHPLPCNLDAERYCLGSILLDGETMHSVRTALDPEDFSLQNHQRLWAVMTDLYDAGMSVDRITVFEGLRMRDWDQAVGGLTYLADLDQGLPQGLNLEPYVRVLKDKAALRRIIGVAQNLERRAYSLTETPQAILDSAQAELSGFGQYREAQRDPITAAELVDRSSLDAILAPSRERGLRLPWDTLDRLLCGIHAGQVVLVAACTSDGKTSLALQMAAHIAQSGYGVLIFSREMEKKRLFRRMAIQQARVDADLQRRGGLAEEDRLRMAQAAQRLHDSPLYLDEQSDSVPAIHAAIRRVRCQQEISVVIVDYLQLIKPVGRDSSRAEAVSSISRGLKLAAMEFSVPFLVLSQVNRDPSKAKRPIEIWDLKESGDIENDADVVLLIRPTGSTSEGVTSVTLAIAKQREGPRGQVPMYFHQSFQCFQEAA